MSRQTSYVYGADVGDAEFGPSPSFSAVPSHSQPGFGGGGGGEALDYNGTAGGRRTGTRSIQRPPEEDGPRFSRQPTLVLAREDPSTGAAHRAGTLLVFLLLLTSGILGAISLASERWLLVENLRVNATSYIQSNFYPATTIQVLVAQPSSTPNTSTSASSPINVTSVFPDGWGVAATNLGQIASASMGLWSVCGGSGSGDDANNGGGACVSPRYYGALNLVVDGPPMGRDLYPGLGVSTSAVDEMYFQPSRLRDASDPTSWLPATLYPPYAVTSTYRLRELQQIWFSGLFGTSTCGRGQYSLSLRYGVIAAFFLVAVILHIPLLAVSAVLGVRLRIDIGGRRWNRSTSALKPTASLRQALWWLSLFCLLCLAVALGVYLHTIESYQQCGTSFCQWAREQHYPQSSVGLPQPTSGANGAFSCDYGASLILLVVCLILDALVVIVALLLLVKRCPNDNVRLKVSQEDADQDRGRREGNSARNRNTANGTRSLTGANSYSSFVAEDGLQRQVSFSPEATAAPSPSGSRRALAKSDAAPGSVSSTIDSEWIERCTLILKQQHQFQCRFVLPTRHAKKRFQLLEWHQVILDLLYAPLESLQRIEIENRYRRIYHRYVDSLRAFIAENDTWIGLLTLPDVGGGGGLSAAGARSVSPNSSGRSWSEGRSTSPSRPNLPLGNGYHLTTPPPSSSGFHQHQSVTPLSVQRRVPMLDRLLPAEYFYPKVAYLSTTPGAGSGKYGSRSGSVTPPLGPIVDSSKKKSAFEWDDEVDAVSALTPRRRSHDDVSLSPTSSVDGREPGDGADADLLPPGGHFAIFGISAPPTPTPTPASHSRSSPRRSPGSSEKLTGGREPEGGGESTAKKPLSAKEARQAQIWNDILNAKLNALKADAKRSVDQQVQRVSPWGTALDSSPGRLRLDFDTSSFIVPIEPSASTDAEGSYSRGRRAPADNTGRRRDWDRDRDSASISIASVSAVRDDSPSFATQNDQRRSDDYYGAILQSYRQNPDRAYHQQRSGQGPQVSANGASRVRGRSPVEAAPRGGWGYPAQRSPLRQSPQSPPLQVIAVSPTRQRHSPGRLDERERRRQGGPALVGNGNRPACHQELEQSPRRSPIGSQSGYGYPSLPQQRRPQETSIGAGASRNDSSHFGQSFIPRPGESPPRGNGSGLSHPRRQAPAPPSPTRTVTAVPVALDPHADASSTQSSGHWGLSRTGAPVYFRVAAADDHSQSSSKPQNQPFYPNQHQPRPASTQRTASPSSQGRLDSTQGSPSSGSTQQLRLYRAPDLPSVTANREREARVASSRASSSGALL